MNKPEFTVNQGRRAFLGKGSALVFACSTSGISILTMNASQAQTLAAEPRAIGPQQLDTWLAFDDNGLVTAFFGKMDMGQGVDTAIAQVVADELDLAVSKVSVVMGDTHRTPNQGGASGSSGVRLGANALRNAAAEARRIFLQRAAQNLDVSVDSLRVDDGVVSVAGNASRQVSYGELIADGFALELDWNGSFGNNLNVTGRAQPKSVSDYRVVGTPVARKDIPGKIMATTEYCAHVSLPGMLHARAVRPPVANQLPVSHDENSIAGITSARAVRIGDFLAVVADTEWAAIKASRELAVTWSQAEAPFPAMDTLFEHIEASPATGDSATGGFGGQPYETAPTLAAIAAAPQQLEATYQVPFQSHARMGPSIGVADVSADSAVIYSDTQKPHDTRSGIARLLGMSDEQVRVVWKPGAGSYGRSDADEAAYEAALLSQCLGQPVRMQWMRHEGHAWDPKAPPCVINCRAGVNNNAIAGWYYHAKGMSGWDVWFNAADPKDTLVGQLTGYEREGRYNFGAPTESYDFPNSVAYWETIAPLQEKASPLRTSHMRAPQEPQIHFAHESFIDEVATATGQDPIALRLRYLNNERERAVLEAVAELSGWQETPAPQGQRSGELLTGRGVALATAFGGFVATVCDVEVEPASGRVWARRFYVAHDCGLIINPQSLRTTIEGNIVQGLSRTLFEEVRFDEQMVRSEDWLSYPILDITDAPESIEIATINRPDLPAGGAGEPSHVTVPAAVANAVFNATGVRLRRLPLSPEYVSQALA